MRVSTMCKVHHPAHGELISVKAHGDTMCFKDFDSAYKHATLLLDPEDPVEIIEVLGAPPGRQFERFFPDHRDEIEVALIAGYRFEKA